ncbi:MAG: hypothetical protein FWC00_01515 [Firmicutes bacterium]|nr:hypothetical protein [Bacillota bacterium]
MPTQVLTALGGVVGFFVLMVIIVAILWNRRGKRLDQEDNDFIASMSRANFISRGDRADVQTVTLGTNSSTGRGGQWSTGATSNVGDWVFIDGGHLHLKVKRNRRMLGMDLGARWSMAYDAGEVRIPVTDIKSAGFYSGDISIRQFVSGDGIREVQTSGWVESKIRIVDLKGNEFIFDVWDAPRSKNPRTRPQVRDDFFSALSFLNSKIDIIRG